MMIVLQLALYCLLFFLLVKAAAGNDGLRCLYFYPKEYQEEAFRRGLAEKETVARQSKRFMIPFCLVMLAALAAILTFWNRAADFKTALWQAALFLVVMNWFDGIVIDRLWVGRSPVWRIRGMEGIPYGKPWKTVLTRRALGTVVLSHPRARRRRARPAARQTLCLNQDHARGRTAATVRPRFMLVPKGKLLPPLRA